MFCRCDRHSAGAIGAYLQSDGELGAPLSPFCSRRRAVFGDETSVGTDRSCGCIESGSRRADESVEKDAASVVSKGNPAVRGRGVRFQTRSRQGNTHATMGNLETMP